MRSWRDTLVRRRASQMSVFATSRLRQALVTQGRRSWTTSRSRHNMSACSKSLHGISSALTCTTDSTVLQPPITLLIHAHYHHRFAKFAFQPWSAPQTNVRLGRYFVNAAATSIAHFEWRHNDRHWPVKYHHFIRVTFVTRMKSFTEHFMRVWIHTCMNSYAYQVKRVWKNTCMQNSVYDIALWYTYKKLHIWKITRMKSYTYEKLHVGIDTRIEYWVLIGAFLYTYRFFRGTFDTC